MRRTGVRRFWAVLGGLVGLLASVALSQTPRSWRLDPAIFQNVVWRNIGPANMGGRITDIEGIPGNPYIIYVGTASSGLWKTTDGGITWTPIFDDQPVHSIGDIAVDPRHPDVLWVGTGEDNPRNTVSFGNGVYKSTDGGKTWQHMGLSETRHIARVLLHPTNPDIVYVAAIGHVFGPHPERGVFMTTDGGKTWQKVLYIDDVTGASDLEMDPSNPNILYAGMWTFQRKPWTHQSGSERGGLFKSVDGGRTWKKLTNGLPKLVGRVGVKVAPSNPNVVYAILESKEGTIYRSDDRGETWRLVSREWRAVARGFYYTELRVDPQNENRIFTIATQLHVSIDGGQTLRRIATSVHVDHHTLWIDPQDPRRILDGNDGGIAVSFDGGERWEFLNTIPMGQFYRIAVDPQGPFYKVCGGLQDNGSWCGPARNRNPAGILNDDWFVIGGGDGFHVVIHREKPYLILGESQGGNIYRIDLRTGRSQSLSPYPAPLSGSAAGEHPYRFDWNAPIVPSPHDPDTVYFGGNVLFRSTDFGLTWEVISPDLTTRDPEKLKPAGGPIRHENTTAEYHCVILSIAESPVQKGVLWVGTDDGQVHVSRDGGRTWENVTKNIRGLPPDAFITRIEASRTGPGVAYLTADRHMLDDYRPYVFKTTDFGKTWTNIAGNLPSNAYVHVIREDPRNPNLLYVGTELGLFASFTGGGDWVPLRMKNFPTAAVHDVLVHPTENDLVVGTHGRSVWILDDVGFLQQLTPEVLASDVYFFDLRDAWRYNPWRNKGYLGDKAFRGSNGPSGALITYYLKNAPDEKTPVKIQVLDAQGNLVREIEGTKYAGINRVTWDLRHTGPRLRRPEQAEALGFFGPPPGPQVLPGDYTVRLVVGDKSVTKPLRVRLEPDLDVSPEDLRAQWETAMRLRDMVSSVNDALRTLDGLEQQAKTLQQTLRTQMEKTPEAVAKALEGLLQRLTDLRKTLVRDAETPYETSPQLLEKLASLLGTIDRANAAPTRHQMEYLQQLETQYKSALDAVRRFLDQEVPAVNQTLQQNGVPPLLVPRLRES